MAMAERPHRADRGPVLGVILAGGLGTRLRPLTHLLPKAMVPLLNRPLIAYAVEMLASAGIDEVVVVVSARDEGTEAAARRAARPSVRLSLAVQAEPRGSGDAVLSVGAALEGRPVVVLAVDTVLTGDSLAPHVAAFSAGDEVARVVLHRTSRPREMGIVELAADGERIIHLEEKPDAPRSDLALVAVWMLAPPVVERLRAAPHLNRKGENDLSGTLAVMVGEGAHLSGSVWDGEWLDAGSLPGLLDAQDHLLAAGGGAPLPSSARLIESAVRAPVLLGEDVLVERSIIGPKVVIGRGAVLRDVQIARALVAPGARLVGGAYQNAVVTPDGVVVGVAREPPGRAPARRRNA